MKEIVVLSGKGGTGKTCVVASLAALAPSKVLADCVVDAASLHLLLNPIIQEKHELWSRQVAFIDEENCNQCGLCEDTCRSGAISNIASNCRVDSIACKGCRLCYHVCPEEAITMQENLSGNWFISSTKYGPLVHAELGITQENSGKLVTLVRQKAKQIAEEEELEWIISDGPAGIGSPVISSLLEANLALLVTEPTLSGIHGLERVLSVCQRFSIPALVCINKYDINEDNVRHIESYCLSQGIDIASRIPFDNTVAQAVVQGLPAVEYSDNSISPQIKALWEYIIKILESKC